MLTSRISVAADVQGDVRHLHLVDVIVAGYHVVESVFPIHCHQGILSLFL